MTPLMIAGALAALAVLAALGALVASRIAARRLVVNRVEGAVEVPGSRAVVTCLLVSLLSAVGFAVALLVTALVEGEIPGSSAAFVVALAVPLLALPVLIGLVRGRYSLNRLRLTREAVEVHSYRAKTSIAWEDVADVVRTSGTSGRWVLRANDPQAVGRPARGRRAERSVNPGRSTDVDIQTGLLLGGDKVVGLIEDYLHNPRKRREI